MARTFRGHAKAANRLLWSAQLLLALLFLFAGIMKLILPVEEMTRQIQLPGSFLRFIGVCEICGALGLVLPGLLRIQRGLTPIAAAGLVIIMIGAVSITVATSGPVAAVLPLVAGIVAGSVAWGRRGWLGSLRPIHAALEAAR